MLTGECRYRPAGHALVARALSTIASWRIPELAGIHFFPVLIGFKFAEDIANDFGPSYRVSDSLRIVDEGVQS